jgi:hypothetical protein
VAEGSAVGSDGSTDSATLGAADVVALASTGGATAVPDDAADSVGESVAVEPPAQPTRTSSEAAANTRDRA